MFLYALNKTKKNLHPFTPSPPPPPPQIFVYKISPRRMFTDLFQDYDYKWQKSAIVGEYNGKILSRMQYIFFPNYTLLSFWLIEEK